jgi:hypothetical protein
VVKYLRVEANSRAAKLEALEKLEQLSALPWEDVSSGWMDPFYPRSNASFFFWPELSDLFPWQHSGSQYKRLWPIAENRETLERRWVSLCSSQPDKRGKLFRETRDRKINRQYKDFDGLTMVQLSDLTSGDAVPLIERYCYRTFDRHYAFIDNRLGDYLRPPLIRARSAKNVFFASLVTKMLGAGPAMIVTSDVPDLDVFCGRGGKDVIPLYRNADGTEPNVTGGLLDALGNAYGVTPSAEDLAAYLYAVLGGKSYARRFWDELETPGPRVPLTKDSAIFAETAELGRKLIWLHTYAERFRGDDRGEVPPQGRATTIKGVSSDEAHYPARFGYDAAKQEIAVGDGRFGPVAREVWEFEVSGLKVVQSWLGYRMKKRAGKKSSPLDDIRPEHWTARMSDDFLELLWVLEATLAIEPELEAALDKIVAGLCFISSELPTPKLAERKAPGSISAAGALLELMGVEEDDCEAGTDDEDD